MPQSDIFMDTMSERRIVLPITKIYPENLELHLIDAFRKQVENKCAPEGYILPSSIAVDNYSCPRIHPKGVEYDVVFHFKSCYPVEGMVVEGVVVDIITAGIHLEYRTEDGHVPLVLYITRDHQYRHPLFEAGRIKKGDTIRCRIFGVRFELNDPHICVLAEFADEGGAVGGAGPGAQDESSSSSSDEESSSDDEE